MLVFDCGGRGGLHRSWKDFGMPITYISFEADFEEAENLGRSAAKYSRDGVKFRLGPYALSDKECTTEINLYDTRELSSLFELNHEETYRYFNVKLENSVQVQTTTLASYSDVHNLIPRFLTIDAQGSTLSILKGGKKVLRQVLGIRCEVELFSLYKMAPLFDHVFAFLRNQAYRLLRLEMCGPGLYGVSTEMNQFSVSPWDARPSWCDMIYANTRLVEDLLGREPTQEMAEAIAYFVAFCIHNGSGYYGLEVLQRLANSDKLKTCIDFLPIQVAAPLRGQVALYLSLPRENVNKGFDGVGTFNYLLGGSPDEAISKLTPASKQKIIAIYSQKFDVPRW